MDCFSAAPARRLPRREDDAQVPEGVPRPGGAHVVRHDELAPPRVDTERRPHDGRQRHAPLGSAHAHREGDARASEVVPKERVCVHVLAR